MGREPPLTDHELRVLRGVIDEYERERFVHQWLTSNWKFTASVIALLSTVAVLIAAVVEIIRLAKGG